jgi:hypothetical protein
VDFPAAVGELPHSSSQGLIAVACCVASVDIGGCDATPIGLRALVHQRALVMLLIKLRNLRHDKWIGARKIGVLMDA